MADGSQLNFETGMSHNITIQVTDSTGRTYDEVKAINVNELSEYGDTYQAEVMANAPVAYWRLQDGGGASAVAEVGGVNGTNVLTDPESNAAFDDISTSATGFDGNGEFVSIPDSNAWDLTDGSVQLWFQANDPSGTQGLISRDASGTGEPGHFDISLHGNDIHVRIQGDNGGTLKATNVVSSGTWYQLTVTFGAQGAQIYLNGSLLASDNSLTQGIDGNNEPWIIGASGSNSSTGSTSGANNFFNGAIAEVAIFDNQLPETTIDDLYAAGNSGTDLITETSGNDTNTGTTGVDFIAGGAGNDHLTGGLGNDRLYGDGGDDYLGGGSNDDILSGGAGADELRGQSGIDILSGGDGDDLLIGGSSADQLFGGAGSDTASYFDSGSGVTINLNTGAASGGDAAGDTLSSIENLTGSAFADAFTGNSDANIFTGNDGNDTFQGLAGADTMYGGVGSDIFTIGHGDGNDIIDGGAGGGWTDNINLLNADNSAVGSGWTISLTTGSEVADDGSTKTLSDDAAGTITLEDGTQIAFQNIETIDY